MAVEVFVIRGAFDLRMVWSLPVPSKMDSGVETSFIEKWSYFKTTGNL